MVVDDDGRDREKEMVVSHYQWMEAGLGYKEAPPCRDGSLHVVCVASLKDTEEQSLYNVWGAVSTPKSVSVQVIPTSKTGI